MCSGLCLVLASYVIRLSLRVLIEPVGRFGESWGCVSRRICRGGGVWSGLLTGVVIVPGLLHVSSFTSPSAYLLRESTGILNKLCYGDCCFGIGKQFREVSVFGSSLFRWGVSY